VSTLIDHIADPSHSILWRLDLFDRRVAWRIHVHDFEWMDVAARQLAIPENEQESLLSSTCSTQHLLDRCWPLHYGDRNMGGCCQHQEVVRDRSDQQPVFLCRQLRIGVSYSGPRSDILYPLFSLGRSNM
jgi:hypothetical protein